MRDREQRLRWIEKLIGSTQTDTRKASALVIPTMSGDMAIAFESIVEVVAASKVRPMAFLPPEFCGVLHHDDGLVPVVEVAGDDDTYKAAHVALVQGRGCLLGLKFNGAPWVVDLDETEHTMLEIRFRQEFAPGTMPVLDVDAVVEALLRMD